MERHGIIGCSNSLSCTAIYSNKNRIHSGGYCDRYAFENGGVKFLAQVSLVEDKENIDFLVSA